MRNKRIWSINPDSVWSNLKSRHAWNPKTEHSLFPNFAFILQFADKNFGKPL